MSTPDVIVAIAALPAYVTGCWIGLVIARRVWG
jgi:hypothetical protein